MSATLQPPLSTPAVRGWLAASLITAVTVVLLLLIFFSTAASTVAIWDRSETFAHGFLIFPISIWLIWRRRDALAQLSYQPDWRGLGLLLLLSAGWLFAHSGGVLVGEQLMLVAMIPAAVWTLLGLRVVSAMAFPLGFLLLAVPMGEALIPHMMTFTANFTVKALQLTGIPVYQEGTFFTIPSGEWSVVEGCSGLRYLIASFTLGVLYAYLTYRSLTRRIIFSLAAIVVPVLANGMRAYMIVMIADLSDMKLALGVDHLIYGWVWFGVVMLAMFWIGGYWRQDQDEAAPVPRTGIIAVVGVAKLLLTALLALLVVLTGPAYAAWLAAHSAAPTPVQIASPAAANGWVAETAPFTDWQPHYVGPDGQHAAYYSKNGQHVMLYLAYYRTQRQDSELITSQNYMIMQKHPRWSNIGEAVLDPALGMTPAQVIQTRLRAPDQKLLVLRWDQLDGRDLTNDYLAKLLLARDKVLGKRDDGTAIVIATPYTDDLEAAKLVLRAFIHDMRDSIATSLGEAAQR
ncbi:MAG TPA: exosortase A [Betaproteobacteria bacterium]|nr:exosortase A [Betaproteobacteria bacterium]